MPAALAEQAPYRQRRLLTQMGQNRFEKANISDPFGSFGYATVFGAVTFKEGKRIPMDKPVGKYKLHNQINRSEGTSH